MFVQNLWLHSYNTRSVSKHWCFVVCAIGRETTTFSVDLNILFLSWTLALILFWWYLHYRYFFAEVFDFFRNFFLIVFHGNILLMLAPLALRLNHRPCFLAFVYIAISSMLKSYPSVSCFFFHQFLFLPN